MFKYIFLFILLVVFVRPVRNFLFYLLVGRQIAKQQKKANDIFKGQQRKEGDISVENPTQSQRKDANGGQYVDYQEIK